MRAGSFPGVLPIVLYTSDAPWNAPPDTLNMFGSLPEALWAYLLRQKYVLIDLCRLDAGRPELRDSLLGQLARFRQAKRFEEVQGVLVDMARVLGKHPELQRVFAVWTTLWLEYSGVPGNWGRELNTIEEVSEMLSIDVARWREEFLAQGRAEGRAEGRTEGREEGALEEKKATALQMLRMGRFSFTLEDIAEITRLSLEEVRALAEKNAS